MRPGTSLSMARLLGGLLREDWLISLAVDDQGVAALPTGEDEPCSGALVVLVGDDSLAGWAAPRLRGHSSSFPEASGFTAVTQAPERASKTLLSKG